jgi:hypothetical protein
MDTPMHGKRVELSFERKRFRCTACGKTLLDSLPSMDGKRQMTSRLVAYIEQRCIQSTFAEVSREVGVDDKTIRHVFDDYTARTQQTVVYEVPRVLGIDELKIVGEYRCMLTNIEKNSVFDLLKTRRKVELLAYFKDLRDKKNIEVVTMETVCGVPDGPAMPAISGEIFTSTSGVPAAVEVVPQPTAAPARARSPASIVNACTGSAVSAGSTASRQIACWVGIVSTAAALVCSICTGWPGPACCAS